MLKKIIAALAILTISLNAAAEFRWGPTAGINITNLHWKQDLIATKHLCGPNAGIMGELMIPGIGFGIDFALRYNMHGANVDFAQQEVWAADGFKKQDLWIHTLQVPVNLRFKWTRMEGFEQYIAPFAYAGPMVSFNLATSKCAAIDHPAASFGVQCGIGAEIFEHWQISGGYHWGFSYEIRTVKLDNFSASQRGWNINLTYLF